MTHQTLVHLAAGSDASQGWWLKALVAVVVLGVFGGAYFLLRGYANQDDPADEDPTRRG